MPHSAAYMTVDLLLAEPLSHRLPVDVEAYIAQFCNQNTLTRLSRVNRSWCRSSEPSLYQQVRVTYDTLPFQAADSSMRLLWQLAQNPRRAALVRTLDASRVQHPDFRRPLFCTRCEKGRPGTCSSTTMPYPTTLLGDMIGPDTTGLFAPPDADTRIWATASRKITTCLCAKENNLLVFWSNFYLALRACTNLRAVLLPPEESVCGLTAIFVRLLQDRVGNHFNVLQIPWSIFTDTWVAPVPTIDFAPVVERMARTATSSHLQVIVVDDRLSNRAADLLCLEVLSKSGISVLVNDLSKVHLVPALYDGELSSKSMEAYFQDVGVYLDWRQDLELKSGTTQCQIVYAVFNPSQFPHGIDFLVKALLRAGTFCAHLHIEVNSMFGSSTVGRKQDSKRAAMTPEDILLVLAPLTWLDVLVVQEVDTSNVFPFTTKELVEAARDMGLPRRLRVRLDQSI